MATRCTATTKAGRPCRAWAVHAPSLDGPDLPRCSAHGGGKRPVGAPKENRNAEKHGWYSQQRPSPDASPDSIPSSHSGFYSADPTEVTIDGPVGTTGAIAGLVDKMTRLDDIIATAKNGNVQDERDVIRLFELYTQASSHLSRLLRDRRALSGEAALGKAAASPAR